MMKSNHLALAAATRPTPHPVALELFKTFGLHFKRRTFQKSLAIMLSYAEVAKHNTKDDVWLIIHGEAYDLSEFLPDHPVRYRLFVRQNRLTQFLGKREDPRLF
jgi:Cytochrome b5-like Heme/Steroid binding domain